MCALLAPTAGAERYPVVASCPDGSVIFAKERQDVSCEGALFWSPGSTPRVGPRYYREALRAHQREAWRERALEQSLDSREKRTEPTRDSSSGRTRERR